MDTNSRESLVHARWLTGKGPGALSVLKVSGVGAWSLLREGFRSVKNSLIPENPLPGSAWLGTFPDSKGRGDQVLLVWRECSGGNHAEIQSHHGPLADEVLAKRIAALGIPFAAFEHTTPEHANFASSRGFFEGEKLSALAKCPNRIWLERIFALSEQEWPREIAYIKDLLDLGELAKITQILERSLSLSDQTMRMTRPFEVLIAGPPNAGKSSLMNRLVGFNRAIVSSQAGTTRDLVTGQISLNGWLVNLTDSAGLRDANDPLEALGIQKAIGQTEKVDAVIWVTDVSVPSNSFDLQLDKGGSAVRHFRQPIFVQNKGDLLPDDLTLPKKQLPGGEILISAKSGKGIEELLWALGQYLGIGEFPKGLPIPFSSALIGCLHDLLDLIKKGKTNEALQLIQGWGVPSHFKD